MFRFLQTLFYLWVLFEVVQDHLEFVMIQKRKREQRRFAVLNRLVDSHPKAIEHPNDLIRIGKVRNITGCNLHRFPPLIFNHDRRIICDAVSLRPTNDRPQQTLYLLAVFRIQVDLTFSQTQQLPVQRLTMLVIVGEPRFVFVQKKLKDASKIFVVIFATLQVVVICVRLKRSGRQQQDPRCALRKHLSGNQRFFFLIVQVDQVPKTLKLVENIEVGIHIPKTAMDQDSTQIMNQDKTTTMQRLFGTAVQHLRILNHCFVMCSLFLPAQVLINQPFRRW